VSDLTDRPTTIAFYLPQFYPIPENDAWYGAGFTEWRNVAQARPLFGDHYQPHVPADLGFYDLRVREVREQQARLARQYGIDAFCYYHYWFQGHRPLKTVIDDMLSQGTPDIPFCLAWANENWSRHWDASRHEVLLRQTYSDEDDDAHGRWLLQVMSHPRYLRVDGRPILFVYRIQAMPDAHGTMERWREMWREAGLGEVEIIKFDTHGDFENPAIYGADAAAQFLPHGVRDHVERTNVPDTHPNNQVYLYEDVVRTYLGHSQPDLRRHECVIPAWDNTPRRGDGASLVIHGSTPEQYGDWLAEVRKRTPNDGLVLINAWNEWAEGAHLEPDLRWGRAYLEATARAVGAPELEEPAWGEEFGNAAVDEEKRLSQLYLEAYEAQSLLQRRLSRLEATLERQIEFAAREAEARAATAEAHAAELAREIDRLRAEG
jgi:lipopolysaccharide biosynthesis protein